MAAGASLVSLSKWVLKIERSCVGGVEGCPCSWVRNVQLWGFATLAFAECVLSNEGNFVHLKQNTLREGGMQVVSKERDKQIQGEQEKTEISKE